MNSNVKCAAKAPVLLILASFIIAVAGMKVANAIIVPFLYRCSSVICTPPLFWLQRKGVPKVLVLVLIPAAILLVQGKSL